MALTGANIPAGAHSVFCTAQALEKNNQMLQEQLEILCQVPDCQKAAQAGSAVSWQSFWQDLKKRRALQTTLEGSESSLAQGVFECLWMFEPKI